MFQSDDTAIAAPIDWGSPCMTGQFVIGGQTFVTYAYPMSAKPMTWPSVGGIYSLSGVYPGNDGRNLVGKTDMKKGFHDRWLCHRHDLRYDKHGNPYMQTSYDRHPDEFVFWALETGIPEDKLGQREAFWYHYLQSDKALHGWNIQVPTDEGSCRLAAETKEKLRQANLGKRHTEETKRKMSETRQRDGTWNRGLTGPAHHCYGKKLSSARRRFLSEINRGEKNPHWGKQQSLEVRAKRGVAAPNCIPFRLQYPTGEIYNYCSAGDFARREGVSRDAISYFLSTARVGDTFMGWTMIEPYAGQNLRIGRKIPPEVTVRHADGREEVVRNITTLARSIGVKAANVSHFLVRAPVGAQRFGLTKISIYTPAAYVAPE